MTLVQDALWNASRVRRRLARVLASLRGRPHGGIAGFVGTREDVVAAGRGSMVTQMFLEHRGRHTSKWSHYLPAYEEQLCGYRDGFREADGLRRPLRFLEIGVSDGGSLQFWRNYLGSAASIWGIDINERCLLLEDEDLEVRIGSQNDSVFLRRVIAEMGGVDVILDDGSHEAQDQRIAFETLFPLLSIGGTYVVEDVHTSYWGNFGGGYRRHGTFVEVTKGLLDDLHGWYHQKPDKVLPDARSLIERVTVYDSIVFIKKAALSRPTHFRFGTASL